MTEKLLEIKASSGLVAGIFPSLSPETGPVWADAKNVLFREAEIEVAKGDLLLTTAIARAPGKLAQAYVAGVNRLYYEDNGAVFYYADGVSTLVGVLDPEGTFDLEVFGAWLLATDNISPPKVWKNTGTFIDVSSELATAKMIRRLKEHVLYFATDEFPTGFEWGSRDDPQELVPSLENTAGNLSIREIDSEIIAVSRLGQNLGVYSRENLYQVYWVGGENVFGYRHSLSGIGAASAQAIVSYGPTNCGIFRGGVFVTDGSSFTIVDRPAIAEYIREKLDWAREGEISGFYNELTNLVEWSVPITGGSYETIGFDPVRKTFTKLSRVSRSGIERQIFNYPVVATSSGIEAVGQGAYTAIAKNLVLRSKPLSAGSNYRYKHWGNIVLEGTFGNALKLRLGYSDQAEATPEWSEWQVATPLMNFIPRESVYLTLDFGMDYEATASYWKLSGITVTGHVGGLVAL